MINPKLRRTLARITLPFFLLWSLWIPQQAYAFVPAGVYGSFVGTQAGIAAASGGGGAVAAGGFPAFGAGAAAFGIGLALGYFAVDYLVGDHYETQRIPLTNDPSKQVPAPDAPSTDAGDPKEQWMMNGYTDVSASAVCSKVVTLICSSSAPVDCSSCTYTSGACKFSYGVAHYGNPQCASTAGTPQYVGVVLTCPNGYTQTGTICTLVDAREARPDHACDYSRSGNTLAMINDPDCAAVDLVCNSTGCVVVSADSQGNPRRLKITPSADGGSQVQIDEQRVVNGQTQVVTTKIGVGPSGTVGSVTGEVNVGTVPSDGGDPTTNPSEQTQIQFPTDYARTGEAASAATQIVQAVSPKLEQLHTDNIQTQTKLDTLHDDLTKTEASTDPEAPLPSDMPWVGATFASLTAWTVPGHVAVCPTYDLDLSSVLGAGKVFTFDAHCGLLNDQQNNMRLASLTAWLILSLFIVLRA